MSRRIMRHCGICGYGSKYCFWRKVGNGHRWVCAQCIAQMEKKEEAKP